MSIYIVERQYAKQQEPSLDDFAKLLQVNNELGIKWLYSFLSTDHKKTYCLYEAKSRDTLIRHAEILGLPVDQVVEVGQVMPQDVFGPNQ